MAGKRLVLLTAVLKERLPSLSSWQPKCVSLMEEEPQRLRTGLTGWRIPSPPACFKPVNAMSSNRWSTRSWISCARPLTWGLSSPSRCLQSSPGSYSNTRIRVRTAGLAALVDAYVEALHDVPWWAVRLAIFDLHRRSDLKDAAGQPIRPGFSPMPSDLRRWALLKVWPYEERRRILAQLSFQPIFDRNSPTNSARRIFTLREILRVWSMGPILETAILTVRHTGRRAAEARTQSLPANS